MTDITYRVVQHDGGWAYTLGDVFSKTFPTRDAAMKAARHIAKEQEVPGETRGIIYEDENGQWREELSDGHDRPHTGVVG
jgi:hypothetical protein